MPILIAKKNDRIPASTCVAEVYAMRLSARAGGLPELYPGDPENPGA